MRSMRYSTSRQKACYRCATAKAKCDRKQGGCGRCELRGLPCSLQQGQPSSPRYEAKRLGIGTEETPITSSRHATIATPPRGLLPSPEHDPDAYGFAGHAGYPSTRPPSSAAVDDAATTTATPGPLTEQVPLSVIDPRLSSASTPAADATLGLGPSGDELDFSNMDLACPINADDIANRWLNNFVPLPGQTPKEYSPSVADFIHRMLNSYASVAIRGHKIPPFVHWSQLTLASSLPLSTCLSVIRMCDKPLRGSEAVVAEVLQREMTKLFDQRASFDDMTLLAAFQAHLIYAMVIFFRLGREYYSYLRQAMMDAQELASALSRRGLMCSAEQHGSRPAWEAWIAAETKRRTLYTMCMFDSALLRHDGLPSHLATELRGLLAPGSKALWEAAQRREWEVRYNRHLATWNDGGLRIDELWPIPRGLCEADVARRRERVDIWLEDLDEYGTMMYAVTSCTHGG